MKFDDLMPDRHLDMPVYRQLVRRFRDAIETGKLAPGKRVPSVRSLASELDLARGTVEAAYQILIGEGYLVARGPAGTVVSPQLPDGRQPRAAAPGRTNRRAAIRRRAGRSRSRWAFPRSMRFRACRGYGSRGVMCGRWRPRRWTTRRLRGTTG